MRYIVKTLSTFVTPSTNIFDFFLLSKNLHTNPKLYCFDFDIDFK